MAHKPELSICRKALTKAAQFLTLIDDIYDIYGQLDELEAFTSAVERFVHRNFVTVHLSNS